MHPQTARTIKEAIVIGGVHHLGYRVQNLDSAIAEYQKLFGSTVVRSMTSATGTRIAFVTMGAIQLELMEYTNVSGQVYDHVAYEVDDLDKEIAGLKAKGATFETAEPVSSATGAKFIFVNIQGTRIQVYKPGN
jgi:predicted enzyme related to lactoylglutathione lyase